MGGVLADAVVVVIAFCCLGLIVFYVAQWALQKRRGPATVKLLIPRDGKPTEVTLTEPSKPEGESHESGSDIKK